MNQQTDFSEVETSFDTVEVTDMHQFIELLSRWHTNRISRMKHMLEVPETAEVVIGDAEAVRMTGDFRKGFDLGITLALAELGTLPFVAELEEARNATSH